MGMKTSRPVRRERSGGVYLRILLCFLSFLLPIAAIGIGSYMNTAAVVRREFTARIATNLASQTDMIEMSLEMAEAMCLGFFGDDSVQESFRPRQMLSMEGLSERWRIPRVVQRVENAIGDYADRIFAFIDPGEIWVSGGMNELDFFFDQVYRYRLYDASFFRSELKAGKAVRILPASDLDGLDTTPGDRVVPILMKGKVNDCPAVLVLNVSCGAIARTLRGGSVFPSTAFMVLDAEGGCVLAEDPSIGSWVPDPARLRTGVDFQATVGGRLCQVSSRAAGGTGWIYLAVTPIESLRALESGILGMTLFLCLVLTAMSLAFAFIFSSVLYSPIRALRDAVLRLEGPRPGEEPKRQNEFATIRQGLARLQADGERSRRLVDVWTREYVENAFRFLLRGHPLGGDRILREALETEYGFRSAGYVCAVILLHFAPGWYAGVQDTERLAISEKVKEVILQIVLRRVRFASLEFRQDCLAVVADCAGAEERTVFMDALAAAMRSFEYDGGRYTIASGVGGIRRSLGELAYSWDEAMTAASRRNPAARFQVLDAQGIRVDERVLFTPLEEQDLLNALKEGNRGRIGDLVDSIFHSNECKGASWSRLRVLRDDIVSCGNRFLAEWGTSLPVEAGARAGDWAEGAGADGLREDAKRILFAAVEACSRAVPPDRKTGLAANIARYVEGHFDRGLCLERIASEMGVSAKHVSRVFKEYSGENLSDYIDRVRMAKARELLLSTPMRIREISEAIGIDSRATFLRVFRRTEGLSPSEYRERYGAGGGSASVTK